MECARKKEHSQERKSGRCEFDRARLPYRGGEAPQGRLPPHGSKRNVGVERKRSPTGPGVLSLHSEKSASEKRPGTPGTFPARGGKKRSRHTSLPAPSGEGSRCAEAFPHALFASVRTARRSRSGFAFAQRRRSFLNRAAKMALRGLFASARKSCAIQFTAKVFPCL